MKPIKVYVAGPYTLGDVAVNVREAITIGERLHQAGYMPFIPHLFHFWHMIYPKPYDQWLDIDNQWLEVCDCLLRFEGASVGADKEVELAIKLGKPVFYTEAELLAHYRGN